MAEAINRSGKLPLKGERASSLNKDCSPAYFFRQQGSSFSQEGGGRCFFEAIGAVLFQAGSGLLVAEALLARGV